MYMYVWMNTYIYLNLYLYIPERCRGGTRWAHGCGAQGKQVWVIDTRRGGGTPG